MAVLGQAFIEILPNTAGFASKLEKDVKASVDKASASSGGAFNNLANVGQKALLGLGGAAISGAVLAVKLADTYEQSHARLVNAFQNAGSSVDQYSKQIAAADKAGEHFGLSQDQTEAALARLTQATNDPKKALADLGVAVNLAAARHIDLETAATIVGKVAQGNTTVLKRYGIDLGLTAGGVTQLNKAHDALAKATENLGIVEAKVGITHGNTAANASKLASAHDAVQKATLSLSSAQANLGKVESDIAAGKLTGAAASDAQTRATNAVAAATLNLEAKQRAVGDVEAKLGTVHGITAAQATQLQKAHEAVAAATTKVSSVSSAAGQAIDALGTRFAGSAQAQAETFYGKLAALEAQGKDLGIHVGLVLIPIIERLASSFVKVLSYLEAHKAILITIGALIGTVLVAAIGAYVVKLGLAAAKQVETFGKGIESAAKWAAQHIFHMGAAGAASEAEAATAEAANASQIASTETLQASIEQLTATMQASFSEQIAAYEAAAAAADASIGDVIAVTEAETVAEEENSSSFLGNVASSIAAFASKAIAATASAAVVVAGWASTAAAAAAAFIAENAATLGIAAGVALLIAGIVYLATHWKQVWGDIVKVVEAVKDFVVAHVHEIALGLAILLGPIGLLIAAALELATHWKQVWGAIQVAFDAVVGVISDVIGWITSHWKIIFVVLTGPIGLAILFIRDHINQIVGFVSNVINFVRDHWKLLAGILLAPIAPVLALWLIFPKQFEKVVDDIVGFFSTLPGRILDTLTGIGSLVATAFADAGSWLLNVGGDVIRGLYDGIKTVWTDEITGLLDIGSWLLDILGDAGSWLVGFGGDVIRGLYHGIKAIWDKEITGLLTVKAWLLALLGDVGSWLLDTGGNIIRGLYSGAKGLWDREISGLLNIKDWIVSRLSDALTWLEGVGGDVIRGLKNGITTIWDTEVKGAIDIKGWLTSAFGDAIHWLEGVGGDVIRGLANGMLKFVEDTLGKLPFGIGSHIVDLFKQALGVKSPSTVFAEIGQNLMAGLAAGISQGSGLPQSALDKLALTPPKVPAIPIPAIAAASNPAVSLAGGPGLPSLPGALAAHSDQLDQMNTLLEELTAFLKDHPPLVVKNDIHADAPQTTATQVVTQLRAAQFVAGR